MNVGRFSQRLPGLGGFTNISQNAKKLVFVGFFTCSGLRLRVGDGLLHIEQEVSTPFAWGLLQRTKQNRIGALVVPPCVLSHPKWAAAPRLCPPLLSADDAAQCLQGELQKFVKTVQQVSFSARYTDSTTREVLYITERAVFRLQPDGLLLEEVAPGVDLEKDILSQMQFRPRLATPLRKMDATLFTSNDFHLSLLPLDPPISQRRQKKSGDSNCGQKLPRS